jgi:hypothetical protein
MHQFQSLIQSHVDAAPLQSGEFRGAFSLVGRILDGLRKAAEGITLDDESKAQLKAAALAVFDVAAKAIDIPLVPDATELSIEAWLRSMLAERIDVLLA